jgi:hypothetical protein
MPGLDERDFYEEIQSVSEERRADLQDLAGGENHDIPWFPPKPVAYLGLPIA